MRKLEECQSKVEEEEEEEEEDDEMINYRVDFGYWRPQNEGAFQSLK